MLNEILCCDTYTKDLYQLYSDYLSIWWYISKCYRSFLVTVFLPFLIHSLYKNSQQSTDLPGHSFCFLIHSSCKTRVLQESSFFVKNFHLKFKFNYYNFHFHDPGMYPSPEWQSSIFFRSTSISDSLRWERLTLYHK